MSDPKYILRLNYGGYFCPNFNYIGGDVHVLYDVDPDVMSHLEILDYVKEIGYPINTVVWYKMPKKNHLKLLENDVGVMDMFKMFGDAKVYEIDMFLDTVDIDASLSVMSSYKVGKNDLRYEPGLAVDNDLEGQTELGVDNDLEGETELGMDKDLGAETELGVDNDVEGETELGVDKDLGAETELGAGDDFGYESDSDPTYEGNSESESDDDSLSDFEFFAEDDTLSDSEFHIDYEVVGNSIANESNTEFAFNIGEDEIQSDPDNLSEPNESDGEYRGEKFPEFNERTDMKEPCLKVGLVFANSAIYRKALRRHSILRGFELKFEKNERARVTARCNKKRDCTRR